MLPIKKIYIDSRFMSSDSQSSSNFKIDLPQNIDLPEDTVFYMDDICIPNSWYTIVVQLPPQDMQRQLIRM